MTSHPNRAAWRLLHAAEEGRIRSTSAWPVEYEGAVLLAFRAGQHIPGNRRVIECRSTGKDEITIVSLLTPDHGDMKRLEQRFRFTGDRLQHIIVETV